MSRILPDLPDARPANPDDLAAVAALCIAVDVEDLGEPDWTEADQESDWARPRFDLARDTVLVPGPDGAPVGYASVWEREAGRDYDLDVFVRRAARDQVEDALLAWGEARAARTAEPGATVHVVNFAPNVERGTLIARRGYATVRHFFRMTLPLDGPRPDPAGPPGVEVRPYRGEDERAVYDTLEAAFRGHFRSAPRTYEEWRSRHVERPDHDPTLWFVAVADGEVVGAALGHDFLDRIGWVNTLGVAEPARGRGIGRALLDTAFAEFARRGFRRVDLGVDADNATGATRLYESAGMTVLRRFDFYAKGV